MLFTEHEHVGIIQEREELLELVHFRLRLRTVQLILKARRTRGCRGKALEIAGIEHCIN